MKYFSVVILLVLMGWTWSLATGEKSMRVEQHRQVEAGVEEDIKAFIHRKHPETADIYCHQLYTEIVQPGVELIAHFRCQALSSADSEEQTEQSFQGFLRLVSSDGFKSWNEVGGQIRSPEVRFLKGMKITPERSDAAGK